MVKQCLLVGVGGALGSMLRYASSLLTLKYYANIFPLATFMTNILGCLIIGLLIGSLSKSGNQSLQLLLITGFCGGYATFSTFAAENVALWQNQNYFILLSYTLASVILGCLALGLGLSLSK